MIFSNRFVGSILVVTLAVAGCAQVTKEADFNDVKGLVAQRVDYNLHWNQGTEADREVENAIDTLLKNELTPETAVSITFGTPSCRSESELSI